MSDSYSKLAIIALLSLSACATDKGAADPSQMIENPFGGYGMNGMTDHSQDITLRSKKGDRSVEVSLPEDDNSELQVPMNQKFASDRSPASVGGQSTGPDGVDYQYSQQKSTVADHEIASTFNQGQDPVADAKKREIESQLGLQPSDEMPNMDESYLAKVDVIKQLFRSGRFEAALIETDHMLKDYPTSPRLYEMRGTLLDRMGYGDLALKSWKQALEFEPNRLSLKKIVEKREQQRGIASQRSEGK